MPLLAMVGTEMLRPGIQEPRRGKCPECGATMIAKTGDVVIWHWAHEQANNACPYAGESEWHLAWKARGLDGTQEVWSSDFRRRADVLSPAGFAIEFQHSVLDFVEVVQRERDWHHRLCWVFDARQERRTGLIEIVDDQCITWRRMPRMVRAAVRQSEWTGWGCRTFIDLGNDLIWYAERREPLGLEIVNEHTVYGMPLSTDAVVRNVLRASDATALAAMELRWDLWAD